MIWHTTITPLQFVGYGIAVVGLLVYSESIKRDHVVAVASWLRAAWESSSLDESRLPSLVRRALVMVLCMLITGMLFVGLSYRDAIAAAVSDGSKG